MNTFCFYPCFGHNNVSVFNKIFQYFGIRPPLLSSNVHLFSPSKLNISFFWQESYQQHGLLHERNILVQGVSSLNRPDSPLCISCFAQHIREVKLRQVSAGNVLSQSLLGNNSNSLFLLGCKYITFSPSDEKWEPVTLAFSSRFPTQKFLKKYQISNNILNWA